jgi:Ca2+/Na+ antiporter
MACLWREIDPVVCPLLCIFIYLYYIYYAERKKEKQVESAIDQNQVESNYKRILQFIRGRTRQGVKIVANFASLSTLVSPIHDVRTRCVQV